MIRSQSVMSTDKRKTGLLNSLRNRKSSSKDLNGFLKSKSLNLSAELNTNVANKRHSVMFVSPDDKDFNKENYRFSHREVTSHNESREITKMERSKDDTTNGKDKRVSRRTLKMFRPRNTPPSTERTIATAGLEPSDSVLMETLSLDPLSPEIPIDNKIETSVLSPSFQELARFLDFDEPSTPSKLHRTVNIANMQDLLSSMDDKIVPLGSRKSLDMEAYEIQQLQRRLSNRREDLLLYLVENAMVMSFFQQSADAAMQRLARHWDEIDVDEIFKTEKYHADDSIYLHI